MRHRDTQDLVGGLALTALGLFAAYYANEHYEIGDLRRMGPGFFPVSLGLTLAVLGLLVALPAWFRQGPIIRPAWKTLGLVTLSLVVFSVTLKTLGLICASALAVFLSSMADRSIRWKHRLLLGIGVAAVTYVIFILGLNMVLPVWPWSA
ncbi:MAG: hypothetical protein RJB34_1480 [Pseudomonadota bacterium]|jgi:hypothetical protein